MGLPFGLTEQEHNAFCDSMKCKHGNYCNRIIGLCGPCIMEFGTIAEKESLREKAAARNGLCNMCGRIIGIYNGEYTHNITRHLPGGIMTTTCNVCDRRD